MLPLTTYCPNRPATYKRDTTGRPAESAIYKPDTQPKPRPHAYTHAYTGTPARLHPRKTHCTHPRTHTTARGPAKSQVMSEKGHQKRPKQAESHPHPLTTHASARFRPYAHRNNTPAQHQTCTRTQTQAHKHHAPHTEHDQTHTPHTGEAMSPACGGARLDTTPEHQTNGARRPRRTTRAAQSRSVAIAARAPQKRSQPQT